ncbi:Pfs NACHT and Ankyrin domain protein [Penicillium subrubescens]|uniref:Pfs NACHT and Ankyrin domain protein n=1 Tax=Penicillium subrubescens TaxID=1316194 RepID=UPI00254516A3|nr:Pfs NACHT and Ankyrin domain protein [Penicillium subrubescens]KAJ5881250.1 Pfs NACHT and Ankyrin domain protein [Penicillium subrubescens]
MESISFHGNNDRIQVGINHGSINNSVSPGYDWQRFLSRTNPVEDKKALKRKKGGPAPGTCEWVLRTEEITAWLGSEPTVGPESQPTQVLWLHGNPGTGKSIMAVYLAEELAATFSNTDGGTLAYFFCDSGFDTRNTAISVIKGLLYQLVEQHAKLLDYLLPKYHARGAELFASFDALWEIFITMMADENTGRKYCIIDALDECDRESQDTLLQQLEETFRSPNVSPNVRILVTSRPYPEIRESLQIFPNKDLASFPQRQKDVNIFIEEKVNFLAKRKKYTDKVKGQIREILQDKADGTFLWIGLACGELKDIPSSSVVRTLQRIPKGLTSLYTKLLEAALKDSESTGNDFRHLLSCVVVSSRPLTVLELAEACQLYQEEEDLETRLQFTHEYIESCRLMVIIQDEKVLLLHKSIKDFLVGTGSSNFIQELEAHARLAYRCVDLLIAQSRDANQSRSGFSVYATYGWANHARMAESSFTVQCSQAEFFEVDSPCREWWLRRVRAEYGFETLPTRFSIFHVAAEWGICALVDHAAELGAQKSDRECFRVDVNCVNHSGKTPLEHAAGSRWPNIVNALLKRGGMVTTEVVKAAAGNWFYGEAVMALLLDRCGDQITITDEVVKAAAGNEENGKTVMALLLDRCGDQITITDEVVKAAAGNGGNGEAVVALLLDRCGDQITITDEVVKAAAGNWFYGEAVMALLLDRCRDLITISDEVVSTIAGAFNDKIMTQLLDRRGDQITITDEVVSTIAGAFNDKIMTQLLDRRGDQITITDEVVKAAAGNEGEWRSSDGTPP